MVQNVAFNRFLGIELFPGPQLMSLCEKGSPQLIGEMTSPRRMHKNAMIYTSSMWKKLSMSVLPKEQDEKETDPSG